MSWENTSKSWKGWWSILSFFIWSALSQWNDNLLWEIGDIVHGDSISWGWWLHQDWGWSQNVSLVSFAFATGCINVDVVSDLFPLWLFWVIFLVWQEVID